MLHRVWLRSWIAVGVLVGGVGVAAPAHAELAGAQRDAVDPSTVQMISVAARTILLARANELIADQQSLSTALMLGQVHVASQLVGSEKAVRDKVRENRKWLKGNREAYTRASTELKKVAVTRQVSTLEMRAIEVTFLDYAKIRGDEPPNTGYTAEHVFVFSPHGNGGWALSEDRQIEPSGLLPLRVAVGFVHGPKTMPYNTEPAPASGAQNETPSSAALPGKGK